MRNLSCAVYLLAALAFPILSFAQVQATKDPVAQAVLAQMSSTAGWVGSAIPQDATATGTVTRYHGSDVDTATITLQAKGLREFRTQVTDSVGSTTYILNQDSAALMTPSATLFIPTPSAISEQPFVFPFFSVVLLASEPDVAAQYMGTETVNGQQADKVDLLRQPSGSDPLTAVRSVASHLVVWVSTSTHLPVQIQETHIANDNPTAVVTLTRVFSNYQTVNGIAVPFQQDVSMGQNPLYSLQLQSVNLNVGLTDSDFALPVPAQQ
jgi:hypothetical protein